ncbi:hypothetical protein Rsub_03226 [Raphidocelis subcapitata]|uniref:UBX domain-containing protein n=1 Tax=Raphidocelis subcapitata TaxID=307507 RepID=A0A2V0NSP7_9CHLO|nr:hypothetical protein Rsub_03226 [Raphidocelis subcapitata]|eukprot:GBF90654.1 hypothetical protein Rsub_03226 [Raphidocelis subcapitata]
MAPRRAARLGFGERDLRAWAAFALLLALHWLYTRSTGAPHSWQQQRLLRDLRPGPAKLPPLVWAGAWLFLLCLTVAMATEFAVALHAAIQRALEPPLEGASRGREAAVADLAAAVASAPANGPAGAARGPPSPALKPSPTEAARAATVARLGLADEQASQEEAGAGLAEGSDRSDGGGGGGGGGARVGSVSGEGAAFAADPPPAPAAATSRAIAEAAAAAGDGMRRRWAAAGPAQGARPPSSSNSGDEGEQQKQPEQQRRQRQQEREEGSSAAEDARLQLERHQARMQAAQEAEERQRVWVHEMGGGAGGLAAREAAEQLALDRELRQATDREFDESLAADAAKAAAREAEAEAARAAAGAAEADRARRAEARAALAAALPAEPPAGAAGAVRVRVRLPSGASAERRWDGAAADVGALTDWIQSLEDLPASWQPGGWCLATPFPRAALRDRALSVAELAGGAPALALLATEL